MKTLTLYYSRSGHTKKIAEDEAAESGADIAEIKTAKPLGILPGCLKAMRGGSVKIQPLTVNLSEYDSIKLYSPIWGGNINPAANAVLELIPSGKNIEVVAISGSGKSSCQGRVSEVVKGKGCVLSEFRDVKSE